MEKEFEYLVVRGGHGGHLAEKCLKKYCSSPELSWLPYRDSAVVTRRSTASNKCDYLKTRFF